MVDFVPRQGRTKVFTAGVAGATSRIETCGERSIGAKDAVSGRTLNGPLQYLEWDLKIVTDLYPVRSSLVGIHAGLFYASHPHAFVAACDIPFLKKELVEILLGELEPRWDIILPVTSDGHQPLCAVYSKRCIKQIEAQIKQEEFKIADLFQKVRVKEVPESSLKSADPDLVSFFNINTQKDLAAAEQMNA